MIRRFGETPEPGRRYTRRVGVYAVLPRGGSLLLTCQIEPGPDVLEGLRESVGRGEPDSGELLGKILRLGIPAAVGAGLVALVVFVALRYVSRGIDSQELFVLSGVASALFMGARFAFGLLRR